MRSIGKYSLPTDPVCQYLARFAVVEIHIAVVRGSRNYFAVWAVHARCKLAFRCQYLLFLAEGVYRTAQNTCSAAETTRREDFHCRIGMNGYRPCLTWLFGEHSSRQAPRCFLFAQCLVPQRPARHNGVECRRDGKRRLCHILLHIETNDRHRSFAFAICSGRLHCAFRFFAALRVPGLIISLRTQSAECSAHQSLRVPSALPVTTPLVEYLRHQISSVWPSEMASTR